MKNQFFNSAIRALSQRAYHSQELRAKLQRKGAAPEEAEEIISQLVGFKYLNDAQYIRNFITDTLGHKSQSIRIIRQRLRQKGVPDAEIAPVIQQYETSELERAVQALRKKKRTLKAGSALQQKQRLARFLLSRGFAGSTVQKALSNQSLQ